MNYEIDVIQETTMENEMIQPMVEVDKKEVIMTVEEKNEPTLEALNRELADLREQLAALVTTQTTPVKAPKNKVLGKVDPNRKYVRLGALDRRGKVPQQQSDLAAILTAKMEVGKEYSEQEVFAFLIDAWPNYRSLADSAQHVTYLFRYYRGLKDDGRHAGFIARGFIR